MFRECLKYIINEKGINMNQTEAFLKGLDNLNIEISEYQMEQFLKFYEYMVEKNKVMNLTGITEWEEVVQKHFLDSLALVRGINVESVERLIDVGTGAGFPGIPLKIAFPHLQITLMDSLNKRIKFLDEVIQLCGLEKIETIHSRAEDLARKEEYREQFDVCVSRAVANLNMLSEYCLPFVKVGGIFVSYKSGAVDEEARGAEKAIQILGGNFNRIEKFMLPDSDITRALVIVDKNKNCAKKYPRKPAIMKEKPL